MFFVFHMCYIPTNHYVINKYHLNSSGQELI